LAGSFRARALWGSARSNNLRLQDKTVPGSCGTCFHRRPARSHADANCEARSRTSSIREVIGPFPFRTRRPADVRQSVSGSIRSALESALGLCCRGQARPTGGALPRSNLIVSIQGWTVLRRARRLRSPAFRPTKVPTRCRPHPAREQHPTPGRANASPRPAFRSAYDRRWA